MAGAGVKIEGHEAALAALAATEGRLADARGMWAQVGASLVTSTQRRFEESRAPDGSIWPPSLRVLAHGGKTLIDTARLMQSITFNAFDDGVEVGTNVVYAAIHQFGGQITVPERQQTLHFKTSKRTGQKLQGFRKAGKADVHVATTIPAHSVTIPARPFLGLDDDDDREIMAIAADWLAGDRPDDAAAQS